MPSFRDWKNETAAAERADLAGEMTSEQLLRGLYQEVVILRAENATLHRQTYRLLMWCFAIAVGLAAVVFRSYTGQ